MRRAFGYAWLALALALVGCASPVPPEIRQAPHQGPGVAQVRAGAAAFIGTQVRWGGTIAAVENGPRATWVQVVSRPLRHNGRPQADGPTEGRFIARVDGFLDPEIYRRGRAFTVVGVLGKPVVRNIGAYPYRFPVVRVRGYYLWPPAPKRTMAWPPPPYYPGPGWYPWGPWTYWPYP